MHPVGSEKSGVGVVCMGEVGAGYRFDKPLGPGGPAGVITMKARHLVLAMMGSRALSGAALAQGGMGMMGGGDEKVTKEQFLKHAEERFGRLDANKDGVIDASDRTAMRECREMMGGMHMMGGGIGDKAGKPAAEHYPAQ